MRGQKGAFYRVRGGGGVGAIKYNTTNQSTCILTSVFISFMNVKTNDTKQYGLCGLPTKWKRGEKNMMNCGNEHWETRDIPRWSTKNRGKGGSSLLLFLLKRIRQVASNGQRKQCGGFRERSNIQKYGISPSISSTTEGVTERILLLPSHPPIIVLFYSTSIQLSALGSSCGRGRMKGFKADHLLLLWGAWRHDA
jgi:hypothetical protein